MRKPTSRRGMTDRVHIRLFWQTVCLSCHAATRHHHSTDSIGQPGEDGWRGPCTTAGGLGIEDETVEAVLACVVLACASGGGKSCKAAAEPLRILCAAVRCANQQTTFPTPIRCQGKSSKMAAAACSTIPPMAVPTSPSGSFASHICVVYPSRPGSSTGTAAQHHTAAQQTKHKTQNTGSMHDTQPGI
ncbi:uncharacterized protein B0H64DRAFT_159751 [Chaetomium fimeti]|uniref:Uncharacterized protein n=1 Tax=Chaetomium fimeti TaxID=1854472 RepID=A0AAE0HGD2_9PEZI|nr:hypothetical protein B0H64DRAFT_159751 [Chaetomium fimeti]